MLLSGGLDSATALYMTKKSHRVKALTFEFHGIARSELESAKAIATRAKVSEHRIVRLPDLREAADIPGADFGSLPPTYIPMRNSIFYSFAASYAEETGASLIVGGHNKDDAEVFPDVGSDFFEAIRGAFRAASPILRRRQLHIDRPLKNLNKVQVVRKAAAIGVPLELTWSCLRSGSKHCWECKGCRGRRRAFAAAGVEDPLSV